MNKESKKLSENKVYIISIHQLENYFNTHFFSDKPSFKFPKKVKDYLQELMDSSYLTNGKILEGNEKKFLKKKI